MKVLIADDDLVTRRLLESTLKGWGFGVTSVSDGAEALRIIEAVPAPAIALLDWQMPGKDGPEICRSVRAMSQTVPVYIILLTTLDSPQNIVQGLHAGADDYVTKPFSTNELLARIRAQLRRTPATEEQPSAILAGDFSIDLDARSVKVAGHEIHLTPKEFDLLLFLARRPGKVVTHRTLLAAVWGANSVEQPEYLRVFIGQLRKKIESDPAAPKYLLTEPWVGYRFEPGS